MQTSEDTTQQALALLRLPGLDGLTDEQTRGATCVWCPADSPPLTAETAVDLGEHMSPLSGSTSPMRWFPRGCHVCTHHYEFAALHDHAPLCQECVDNVDECPEGVGLRRLMRDTRS